MFRSSVVFCLFVLLGQHCFLCCISIGWNSFHWWKMVMDNGMGIAGMLLQNIEANKGMNKWFKSQFLGQLRLHKVDIWFMHNLIK